MAQGRSTNHHDDEVDSDQYAVNKELSLCVVRWVRCGWNGGPDAHAGATHRKRVSV